MGSRDESDIPATLIPRLQLVLEQLHSHRYPHMPNPPSCTRRASVALVLRVRPTFPQRGTWDPEIACSKMTSFQQISDKFFNQDWVRRGDPELLFIKRAARTGDRWTGHIALPGGKRDPEDADDQATSSRETREEVGLDLDADHCLYVGNLPERVITTNWGKVPIMVLCPFVYVLLRQDVPPLALQPTEVHSAHWVSIRSLLSPSLRTFEQADVSDRLQRQRGPLAKRLIRAVTGKLVFSATALLPSESLYCSCAPGFIPPVNADTRPILGALQWLGIDTSLHPPGPRNLLLLWGLTLGVVADLLHQVDTRSTSALWSWPNFSHWDIRMILWMLTHRIRTKKEKEVSDLYGGGWESAGVDNKTFTAYPKQSQTSQRSLASADQLDEYFGLMRKAVMLGYVLRVNTFALLISVLIIRYRRR